MVTNTRRCFGGSKSLLFVCLLMNALMVFTVTAEGVEADSLDINLVQLQPISPLEGSYVIITKQMVQVILNDSSLCLDCIILPSNSTANVARFINISDSLDSNIDQFTYAELVNSEVALIVDVQGGEGPLEYIQPVEITLDGDTVVESALNISIIPISISASFLNLPDSICYQTLDLVMVTNHSILLSRQSIKVETNQPQRLPEVTVELLEQPSHGVLCYGDDCAPLPTFFSYTMFLEQQISYKIINPKIQNYSDQFSIQLSIGHGRSEVVTMVLCIDPLPYPMLDRLGNISAYITGQKPFSSDFLKATQTRLLDTRPQDLVYHLVATPDLGVILRDHMLMSVSSVHNFTQEEVNQGKIVYINKQPNTDNMTTDSFQFRLLNKYYELKETYTALIVLMENKLEVTNTGFTVDEGGEHFVTMNEFYVDVPDGYELRPLYILDGPNSGNIILKRPPPEPEVTDTKFFSLGDIEKGYFLYNHSDDEEITDMMTMLLIASKEGYKSLHMSVSVNISINPINDRAPNLLINHPLILTEGTSVPITVSNLEYEDKDHGYDNGDLIYSMTYHAFYGEICLNGTCTPGYPGFQWRQRDMHGNLEYRHSSGMGTTDFLFFDVYDYLDGGHKTPGGLLLLTILPLVPDRSGDAIVHVSEGGSTIINSSSMSFVSNDISPSEFEYTITEEPSRGVLRRLGSSQSLTSFTQVDINNRNIIYHHDDSNTNVDSFKFRLSVRSYTGDYTVDISIDPVNDDPPRLVDHMPIFVGFTASVHLNDSQLKISDNDTKPQSQLQYRIQTTTVYGVIEKRPNVNSNTYTETTVFTQEDIKHENVRYRHTHPHTQHGPFVDYFTFDITDGVNSAGLYNTSVYILPQTVPLSVISPSVLEGGTIVLPSESIEIHHPYFTGNNGKVSIFKKPSRGFLKINGEVCNFLCDFYTDDLADGDIEYVHSGGEDQIDSFNFIIDWRGILRTDTVNYTIQILPVNDQSPHIVTSPHLDLWAYEIIPLSPSLLLTKDLDTSPSDLVYQFNLTPEQRDDGHFSPMGKPDQEILTFTQEDINNGSIVYVDTHSYDGVRQLKFTVTDGRYTVHGEFNVTATLVKIQKVANTNARLGIKMADNVNITNKQLDYITNNLEINRTMIMYQIDRNFIYGHIVGPQGLVRYNFTQSEVDSGQLMYVHTATDIWESLDMANVTVSAPLAADLSFNAFIDIELLNESDLLAVNVPLNVTEGGSVCFDQHHLDGRNIRYNMWKSNPGNLSFEETVLSYEITTPPAHGSLILGDNQVSDFLHSNLTSGLICYQNDGSEFKEDSISFDVVIASQYGEIGRVSDVLWVNITLVNDEEPVLTTPNSQLTLTHTFWFPLTSNELSVTDEDNAPEEIIFTMDTQSDLSLRLRNITDVSRFTQADIDNGHLMILPNKTGNISFTVEYNDGKHATQSVSIQLFVNEHKLEFVVENPTVRLLQTDQQALITSDIANSTTNGPRHLTQYTITKPPSHGMVLVNGVETDVFTQLDVDNNRVCYKLKNSVDDTQDQFEMVVSNKQAKRTTFNVSVVVGASGEFEGTFLPPAMYAKLPTSLITLHEDLDVHRDISIEVTSQLSNGVLYFKYPNTNTGSKQVTSFDYNDLSGGFIYYKWIPSDDIVAGQNYTEIITGIIRVKDLVPGEFSLTLVVQAPPEAVTLVSTITTTETTSQPSQTEPMSTPQEQTNDSKSQFKLALYVPLIGLIVVVVIAFVVVVGFCCSQSRHIKKKLYHKTSKIDFHKSPPMEKPTSFRQSPTRLPHSPQLTGGFDQEYSDSETSSPDVMMTQTQQPMTTISASHTYLPHSQSSFEPSSSGYQTHVTPQLGGSPTFMRHQESPVVSMTSNNYPPSNPSYAAFTRNELRSSSPVRKVNGTRRNTRPYASMTISSGRGKSSPTRSRDYGSPLHRAHHVHDSTSSLGYDTSSMTQESLRIPTITTPAPVNLDSLINQENISDLYKRTHPLLKPSQHWV